MWQKTRFSHRKAVGTIHVMTLKSVFCLVALLFTVFIGCGPKTTANKPQNHAVDGDIMDTSTWDFQDDMTFAPINTTRVSKTKDIFAIVIATFTGQQHAQLAATTLTQLASMYPWLGQNIRMQPRSRGTVLAYGDYKGYEDAEAQKDLAMLRGVMDQNGLQLFPQIMLVKFKGSTVQKNLHPHDLWTVRREYPTLVPIYTLEVAVWGDFESGQFPVAKRRAVAERYASELRGKGFEAFFYHNDDAALSSVTVGLFGFNALDAETGFYSPEVEAMMSKFPKRLVNGQEVLQYFNPAKPELGASPQRPILAEVPVD
jgi:hypothetical protein